MRSYTAYTQEIRGEIQTVLFCAGFVPSEFVLNRIALSSRNSNGTLTTDDYMSVVVDEIADDDLSREQLKDLMRSANCLVGAYRPSKIKEMKLIASLI
jgi:hypothetical protein